MDKITHEIRLSRWTAIVEECACSGLPKTNGHEIPMMCSNWRLNSIHG